LSVAGSWPLDCDVRQFGKEFPQGHCGFQGKSFLMIAGSFPTTSDRACSRLIPVWSRMSLITANR
jgi:hypothetical protein